MDSNILQVLQGLSNPGELAGGICSFFKLHTARLRNIFESIINQVPDDPSVNVESIDIGEGLLVLYNDMRYIKSVDLAALADAVKKVINNAEDAPSLIVTVRDYAAGVTTTEQMTYDQVVNLMREQSDIADALITTLTSYQDWINNPDLNFEQLTLERVNNLLPSTSIVASKLKQGISSISTRFSNSISEYCPSVLQNVMSLFGIGVNSYSDQTVSTFSGVNAWTVVLGDVVDGINHIIQQAPTFVQRLFDTIGYAIGKVTLFGLEKLISVAQRVVISLTGANNAFSLCNQKGDKTVSSCDWRYVADNSYAASGDNNFQAFIQTLSDFWAGRDARELSIPLFAGTLNFQYLDEHRTAINLILKPLNVTAINVAWNKVTDSHLFYNIIQAQSGLLSRETGSDDYPTDLSRSDVLAFFTELAKNPELYYLSQWKTDADAFMACQCAKIVSFLQLLLMVDELPLGLEFVDAALYCSELADFYIEGEPNYSSVTSDLEPSNYNMLNYLSSLMGRTTAFNNGSGSYNEYCPNTYVTISMLSQLWLMLNTVIGTIQSLEVLDTDGLDCFLPYQNTIVYKKPTYYIPSDADNISTVRGILKTGLTVAAVAAVVITGLAIRSSIKRKAFQLEAKAGQLSWDASENGDVQKLRSAYKIQKRANLLSIIAGTSSEAISDSVSSRINNDSNVNVTITQIKKLISG